jgi:glutathione reductase (NADPH)
MAELDFDLVVVGGGSGGVRAARVAAELGARTALIEAGPLGGTCVNAGCVPKKLLVYGAEYARAFGDATGFGFDPGPARFDWRTLLAHKDHEIARLNAAYARTLESAGVEIVHGRARFADAHTLEVGERRMRAHHVLIATGGAPHVPDVPGRALAITSDQAFHLPRLPERVLLVGAGYIGVEFAGIFNALGARVQLVQRAAQVLSGFDHDVREHLGRMLVKSGITLHSGTEACAIERGASGLRVALTDGTAVETDLVMFATGRRPRTAQLGLDAIKVRVRADAAIVVDDYGRSSLPHVFAVGDCTGRVALTPVAIAEGEAVARTLFGGHGPVGIEYDHIPTAVFSLPPVATVGLPEHVARVRHPELDVYRSAFLPLRHRLSGRDEQSMVKLVVDRLTQRVLGCHVVGQDAPEVIQGFAIALRLGATKRDFDATIGVHPTVAEELVTLRAPVAD